MSKERWFTVAKAARNASAADITIFNNIGDWGITAMDFKDALDGVGDVSTLNVAICSDGGDVSQGFAIYNILANHSARKVVTVQGLAASMASVIAMAGDEVVMPSNSMLMIHNPWGALSGEAEQIKSFGEALETMQDNIADAYVARTGLPKAEVLAMMDRETWLSAKKAKELGFADTVETPLQIAASFNVGKFNHVPKAFRAANEKVKTMSKAPKNAFPPDDDESEETKPKSSAEIRTELLAHAREVKSLCNLAGKPNLADGFIEKDLSLSEVIVALDKAKANGKGGEKDVELNANNDGTDRTEKPAATIDTRGVYSRWNGKGGK